MRTKSHAPLTQEQRDLAARNLALAYTAAGKFARRLEMQHRREDLVSACMEGLCLAARGWDPSRGASFGHYAWKWMSHACQRERALFLLIHVPYRFQNRKRDPEGAALRALRLHLVGSEPGRGLKATGVYACIDDRPEPGATAERAEEAARLLASLPAAEAEAVEAVVMRGERLHDVAARAGASKTGVGYRVDRGLKRLRGGLVARGD